MDIQTYNEKKKPRKSENYTVVEDLLLIAAWERTVDDVIVDPDEGKSKYWNRVWKEYMENAMSYPPRSEKSIVNRFSIIRTKCLKFAGIVQSIEDANPSGMTEQDKLNIAITSWANEEKGGFKLLHCYQRLKNSLKWMTEVMHPTSTQASSSINQGEDGSSFGQAELVIPISCKADKENERKRKMNLKDDVEDPTNGKIHELHALVQRLHYEQMTALPEVTKKIDAFLEIKKEKLELDRKIHQSNVEWREEKLMTVDMTNLTPLQRKYLEMKQTKIFEKAFGMEP
ncbi:Glutathione S-transferase T3-like protein [Drosera capensis]